MSKLYAILSILGWAWAFVLVVALPFLRRRYVSVRAANVAKASR